MSSGVKLAISVEIILIILSILSLITACVKYDIYVKELKEKTNKYEILVNKVGDIE